MENGIEALKIAFGMLIFVLAITITISSFTLVSQALNRIFNAEEAEQYVTDENGNYINYVTSDGGTREVGIETIIPTMYRAYKENFAIHFYDATSGDTKPFVLYEYYNTKGDKVEINYIDLENETHANSNAALESLNKLLYQGNDLHFTGLYNKLEQLQEDGKIFIEKLGEYYMDDVAGATDTADVNKIKKRIITYTLVVDTEE